MKQTSFPLQGSQAELEDIFNTGFSFYRSNQFVKASPFFKRVLEYPVINRNYRLTSAYLLGETNRGVGYFGIAERYYKQALIECEAIRPDHRLYNEWYLNYLPRIQLGLFTTFRRNLYFYTDHIHFLIREAKSLASQFRASDYHIQWEVAKGLFCRQLGEIDKSIYYLKECIEKIEEFSNLDSYLYFHPEHFEGFLLLSLLCQRYYPHWEAKTLAQKVLKEDKDDWSSAIAIITLLHVHLSELSMINHEESQGLLSSLTIAEKMEHLASLYRYALIEKDPYLISEYWILSLIYDLLVSKNEFLMEKLNKLLSIMTEAAEHIPALCLLRAVELSCLYPKLVKECEELHGWEEVVTHILDIGKTTLSNLGSSLVKYGCPVGHRQKWVAYLHFENNHEAFFLELWNSDSLYSLRARLWP